MVFNVQKGKALGPNGSPIDFFQTFWNIVATSVVATLDEARKSKSELKALNHSLLSLIPKGEHKKSPTSGLLLVVMLYIKF